MLNLYSYYLWIDITTGYPLFIKYQTTYSISISYLNQSIYFDSYEYYYMAYTAMETFCD